MKDQTILIIGAGITGLAIANGLSEYFHVIIIEADERLGGRIYSQSESAFSGIIENGAEFIHGHAKNTINLLKQADIKYIPAGGKMYHKEDGAFYEQKEMIEGWDVLMEKMKTVKEETTLAQFLDKYFGGEEYAEIRRQAIVYAQGFDLADVQYVTVKSLYEEWANEGEMYRIPKGYSTVIDYLASECLENGCTIITNSNVRTVIWQQGQVEVHCNNDKIYQGHKAVITVPVSILKDETAVSYISFQPALNIHADAIRNIGWGYIIKVLLEFKEPFWKNDLGFVFSDELFPTWWTQLPDKRPIWTGWLGGVKAKELSALTDEELLTKALESFSAIFEMPVNVLKKNLTASKVINWQKNPYAAGGYSYAIPGTEQSRQVLSTGIENTIYFAGEALYEGTQPGTVEASLTTAKATVERIINNTGQ